MTTFVITYWDQQGRTHVDEVEAEDVEAAIITIENDRQEQIEVRKIEILD